MQKSFFSQRTFKTATLLIAPLITLIAVELMQQSFLPAPFQIILNYLIMALPGLILFLLLNTYKIALLLPSLFFLILGAINHYTIIFRNAALQPWDVLAAQTLLNVLPALKFELDLSIFLAALWAVILIVLCFFTKNTPRCKSPILPIATLAASLFLIIGIHLSGSDSRDDFWDTVSASRRNGFMLNFIVNTQIMHNPPPEDYDATKLMSLYSSDARDEHSGEKPNIIVIMNEAFADLSAFYELNTNKDPLEFYHSLNDAAKGELIVSVFGGGTCNTEYDFLTGNSSFMLRHGSYPMQQFVSKKSPSIASVLKAQGYQTTAVHPYYPNGWNRSRAYPLLGFDKFISLEDFDTPEIMRQFVSDRCTYQKIAELTEQASSPQFIFCVTMQNHLGYDISYDNFNESITFSNAEKFPQTRQYLSLISESDKALKELIDYYKAQDTPTYILFFGDHQPAIDDGFFTKSTSSPFERYTVPFFLWYNKGKSELSVSKISTNYLAPLLIREAGLETTPYYDYLLKLMKVLPVISAQGILTSNGEFFPYSSQTPYENQLNIYSSLQYNQVFDTKNRLDKLFIPK